MASHGVPRVSGSLLKDDATREREQREIKSYRELVDLVNSKVADKIYDEETLNLTSSLLKKNPEFYTIWNHRRRIILHLSNATSPGPSTSLPEPQLLDEDPSKKGSRIHEFITQDLQFLIPLLLQYPKCYWLWNHRLWLLEQASELLPQDVAQKLWREELGLVSKMLNRDRRNFHGWSYRRRVIASLEALSNHNSEEPEATEQQEESLVEQEFAYTTKMIRSDLSNFSAWHNRSKLIPRLLDERQADEKARRKMLDSEFELAQNALLDPVDQSPWFYHQFLISTLLPSTAREARIVQDVDNAMRLHYLEQEITAIKEMVEDSADCKWVYQALLLYSEMYLDVEAGNKFITTSEMQDWLRALQKLDTLRKRKWDDWAAKLGL